MLGVQVPGLCCVFFYSPPVKTGLFRVENFLFSLPILTEDRYHEHRR